MEECKAHERDYNQYTRYIHGYFIPWLQKEREEKRFTEGE